MVAYCVDVHGDSTADDNESRSAVPQTLFGGIALALIALACAWTLYANLFGTHQKDALPAPAITIVTAQPAASSVAVAQSTVSKKRSLLTAPVDVTVLCRCQRYSCGVQSIRAPPLEAELLFIGNPINIDVQVIPFFFARITASSVPSAYE